MYIVHGVLGLQQPSEGLFTTISYRDNFQSALYRQQIIYRCTRGSNSLYFNGVANAYFAIIFCWLLTFEFSTVAGFWVHIF